MKVKLILKFDDKFCLDVNYMGKTFLDLLLFESYECGVKHSTKITLPDMQTCKSKNICPSFRQIMDVFNFQKIFHLQF